MIRKMVPYRTFSVLFERFEHRNERIAPNFKFQ